MIMDCGASWKYRENGMEIILVVKFLALDISSSGFFLNNIDFEWMGGWVTWDVWSINIFCFVFNLYCLPGQSFLSTTFPT